MQVPHPHPQAHLVTPSLPLPHGDSSPSPTHSPSLPGCPQPASSRHQLTCSTHGSQKSGARIWQKTGEPLPTSPRTGPHQPEAPHGHTESLGKAHSLNKSQAFESQQTSIQPLPESKGEKREITETLLERQGWGLWPGSTQRRCSEHRDRHCFLEGLSCPRLPHLQASAQGQAPRHVLLARPTRDSSPAWGGWSPINTAPVRGCSQRRLSGPGGAQSRRHFPPRGVSEALQRWDVGPESVLMGPDVHTCCVCSRQGQVRSFSR